MAPPAFEIRNRVPVFGWGFMAVWLGMVALFTFVMGRDGPDPSQPAVLQHAVLAAFWVFGLAATPHVMSKPCTRLSVASDGTATLMRRTPLRREVETWPPGAIAAVAVRAATDVEGGPYCYSVLVARGGAEHLIHEGRDPEEERALAASLRAALRLAESAPPA